MIVLGIDPGTANTGYGVVKGDGLGHVSLVECGVIRTRAREPLAVRLLEIYEGVTEILARHTPDAMCVEDVFYAKNVRTTVVLGHARGLVVAGLAVGGLAAWSMSNLAGQFLFGLARQDVRAYAVAMTTLVAAALLAIVLPARRAASISPIEALRQE